MQQQPPSQELRVVRKPLVSGFLVCSIIIFATGVFITLAYGEAAIAIGVMVGVVGFFLLAICLGIFLAKVLQPEEVWLDRTHLGVRRGDHVRSFPVTHVRVQNAANLRLAGGGIGIRLQLRVPHDQDQVPDFSTKSAARRTTRALYLSSLVYRGRASETMLAMANVLNRGSTA